MRYIIFSDNQYEEARIISSLSKLQHTWVPHNKASASLTHIIVHPDLSTLAPSVQKLIIDLKHKCRADVVSSDTVVDPSVSKRVVTPVEKKEQVVESRSSSADAQTWEHPVTVFNAYKKTNFDPDATYMAPRQWIKMLPNDDDHAQAPWAEHMASQSDPVAIAKHHAARNPANITFKGAVERVMMANSFGYSFKSTRQKRVEGTLFHDKFRNRKRLTQADTPEALEKRLTELDETLVVKRKMDKENARLARETLHRERKANQLQSKKHAVMLFQQPVAGKIAIKLAGRAHKRSNNKPPTIPKSTAIIHAPKPASPKAKSIVPIKKPLSIAAPPDPLTRWRTKTIQRMAGEVDEESSVSSHVSKISFATAADAIESVEVERKAALEHKEPRRPSRNRLLDRLKQAKKPSSNKVTLDKLHASAREVRGIHKEISIWSEIRGEVTKAPVVIRPRPHTAPSRPRNITQLPDGLLTPSTDLDTERSAREPPKANNIELIRQSILEGCSIKA